MTRHANQTEPSMLLDLRASSSRPLPELWGNVIVLDDVGSLLEHHEEYYTLVSNPEVFGVVCVAVGTPPTPDDGVLLRLPRVLLHGEAVVLWVGDEHGVRWGPQNNRPQRVRNSAPSGLDQLISTLRIPEVFSEIVARVGEFPERIASPGLHLVSGAVEATDPATTPTEAVGSLTMPSADRPAAAEVVDATRRVVALPTSDETALPVVGGFMDETRARAEGQPPVESVVEMGIGHPVPASRQEIAITHEPPVRREVPAFRTWPLPLWMLPITLISGAAGGFLPGPVWLRFLLGGLFALGWFLVGWLLLARRPDQHGERGLSAAAGPAAVTYGLGRLTGFVQNTVASERLPSTRRHVITETAMEHDQYIARSWSESRAVLDALRADGEDDMVQLCRSLQLNYLSSGGAATVLRFAPLHVQQILEANGQRFELGTGIVWTSAGEQAGSVRLLPLRFGTVKSILWDAP